MANRDFPPLKASSAAKRILALTYGVERRNRSSSEVRTTDARSKRREFDLNSAIKHGLMLFLVILAPLPLPPQRRIVSVPFRSVNTLMLVEASVDGRPVTLLVDTGANRTILNARSIGRARLPVNQPVNQGAGIIGNAVRLRVDVEIAHRFLSSQPISVMNLDDLSKRFQILFDGLLGQDILTQFRSVRIDYKTHVIELEP